MRGGTLQPQCRDATLVTALQCGTRRLRRRGADWSGAALRSRPQLRPLPAAQPPAALLFASLTEPACPSPLSPVSHQLSHSHHSQYHRPSSDGACCRLPLSILSVVVELAADSLTSLSTSRWQRWPPPPSCWPSPSPWPSRPSRQTLHLPRPNDPNSLSTFPSLQSAPPLLPLIAPSFFPPHTPAQLNPLVRPCPPRPLARPSLACPIPPAPLRSPPVALRRCPLAPAACTSRSAGSCAGAYASCHAHIRAPPHRPPPPACRSPRCKSGTARGRVTFASRLPRPFKLHGAATRRGRRTRLSTGDSW